MLKARHYQTDGAKGGEEQLPDWLFDGAVNENVLHQVIKVHLLNQRQGTAAAKSRGQVSGGSRKPWRQKGTGRARQGTIRAVQWEGGGVAFPPIPHSWRQRVPKKVRALARRSALNFRAQGERVILVDSLEFDKPKTKKLLEVLSAIGAEGKVLLLTHGAKNNVHLSSRNVRTLVVRPFGEESAYDILWATTIVIEKIALDTAEPSKAHRAAMVSRARGEPEVRAHERAAEEGRAQRRKDRRSHKNKAGKLTPESKVSPTAKPAKTTDEEKVTPKAKASLEAEVGGKIDLDASSVTLPKVADLVGFLMEFDSAAAVETLRSRDNRKTAQALYQARLREITNEREGDDA